MDRSTRGACGMARDSRLALLAAAAAALAACDRVPRDAVTSCQAEVQVLPAKTDILLVVDDSISMGEEQQNLRDNLAAFVEALAESAVPHDFQIGVTTTDVMDFGGQVQFVSGTPYPAGALVAVNPAALTDANLIGDIVYDPTDGFGGHRILAAGQPTLLQDFQANVLLGTHGASKEQPLHAAELALSDALTQGANAGFLRPKARLGVIILTDEDDCSEPAQPFLGSSNDACKDEAIKAQLPAPAAFQSFLDGTIAGEHRDPVLAVIGGFDRATLQPTGCATSFANPTRLSALVDSMGADRSFRGSICDPSFGPSLQRIADMLVPQTVPLDGAPSDPNLLVAAVHKVDGSVVPCPVALEGTGGSGTGAIYTPPRAGEPATLTFENACRLVSGDRVDLRIVCAR